MQRPLQSHLRTYPATQQPQSQEQYASSSSSESEHESDSDNDADNGVNSDSANNESSSECDGEHQDEDHCIMDYAAPSHLIRHPPPPPHPQSQSQSQSHRPLSNTLSRRGGTMSLSSMVPQFQEQLTPVLNSFETRLVIVRSRDRDLFTEHLLQFGVQFGEEVHSYQGGDYSDASGTGGQCTHPTTNSMLCSSSGSKQSITTLGVRRGCVVPQVQRDVADVRLTQLLLPRLTECLAHCPTMRLTQELFVEIDNTPPHRRLLGTAAGITRRSSFWCIPDLRTDGMRCCCAQATDHEVTPSASAGVVTRMPGECGTTVYRPSGASAHTDGVPTHHHQARSNYSSKLNVTVHLPLRRTLAANARFDASRTPDVYRLSRIEYSHASTQITCTVVVLVAAPSQHATSLCIDYPKIGDIVSIRDLHRGGDGAPLTDLEASLWRYICMHGPESLFSVQAVTPPSSENPLTMSFAFDARLDCTVPDTEMPRGDTSLELEPGGSCALNESMQFTMGLEFIVATRRLCPSVVAPVQ
jgi:hypothetical protein